MLPLSEFNNKLLAMTATCGPSCLKEIKRGLEKESLRVTAQGVLSQKSHPKSLGSALMHPYITTDYAEALLEFVTPTFCDHDSLLNFLTQIHQFVLQHIGDEMLWACSMPCFFKSGDDIQIAEYGTSNRGLIKHIYRRGLAARYGKRMQCIAGVHYNFSFPEKFWECFYERSLKAMSLQDFISDGYFKIIRNFERHAWLIVYLFGASPALCKSFFPDHTVHNNILNALDSTTYFRPHATSFRMGDFGYKSQVQQSLNISYNSLEEYTSDLDRAMNTIHPAYEKFSVKKDGSYVQLNPNYLQIENEYYGLIRPKRIASSDERPNLALKRRGVEYLELRCLDLNPFFPTGVDGDALRFLDLFLMYCAFEDSLPLSKEEMILLRRNHQTVVMDGRKPGLQINRAHEKVMMKKWAQELFDRLELIAVLMDKNEKGSVYMRSLELQRKKLADPSCTPSGSLLRHLEENKISFFEFSRNISSEHAQLLKKPKISSDVLKFFQEQAKLSLKQQQILEAEEDASLDEYITRYLKGGAIHGAQ